MKTQDLLEGVEDEIQWYEIVFNIIKKHPDWIVKTNHAISKGVELRLKEEIEYRATAETALAIAYDHAKGIPGNQLDIVKSAIKKSKMFNDTKYVKDI